MAGEKLSHYRLIEKLGEGGMGVVYLAVDEQLGRQVAIKLCKTAKSEQEARRRVLQEARTASAFTSANIARIYEYGESAEGEPFIVMELVKGRSLSELIADGPMAPSAAVDVIRSIALALTEAHRHGVIHRDIKPGNVRINEEGVVKVLDFGLARHVPVSLDQNTMTVGTHSVDVAIQGTPHYMAPEQVRGVGVDPRADLFALGVVFYECLCGKRPFEGGNNIEVLAKVIGSDPSPPSSVNPKVPAYLDHVVMKLLAKAPEDRYASARELLANLVEAPPDPVIPGRPPRRRYALAGAAAVAAAFLAVWMWPKGGRATPPSAEAARWYQQGVEAIRDGAYHKASKALERAVAADPKFAMARAHLAEAWLELDYTGKGREEMLRALPPGGGLSGLPRADMLQLQAIHHVVTGEQKQAIQNYRELASIVEGREKAGALVDLGRAQERDEDLAGAIASFEQVIALDRQAAAGHLRLGSLQTRKRDFAAAAKAFDEADALYKAASNVEGSTEVLYERALMSTRKGEAAEARKLLEQALEATRVTGNNQQRIKLSLQKSVLLLADGQMQEAEAEASRAVELARANGIENLTSRALINLGNSLFLRGETGEARNYLTQALKFAREHKAPRIEARALVNLGSVRIQTGEAEQGWRDVDEALGFYRRGGYGQEAALSLVLLGRAMKKKGDSAAARRAFDEAIRTAGETVDMAVAREGVASLLLDAGAFPGALDHYKECARIYKQFGSQIGAGYTAVNLAYVHRLLGNFDAAASAIDEASRIADALDSKALRMAVYRHGSLVEAARGRGAQARMMAKKSLELADRANPSQRSAALEAVCLAEPPGRKSMAACQEAFELAVRSGDKAQEAASALTLARVAAGLGERGVAQRAASVARDYFARSGQPEGEWQALALLAKAGGDAALAAEASKKLSAIGLDWPPELRKSYLARPEIQVLRK